MASVSEYAKRLFASWGLGADQSTLWHNFVNYGPSMEIYNFEDFKTAAKKFLDENLHSKNPDCTVIPVGNDKIGVDYRGEKRGIYYKDTAEPFAFFIPNYQAEGFSSKAEELRFWKAGSNYRQLIAE